MGETGDDPKIEDAFQIFQETAPCALALQSFDARGPAMEHRYKPEDVEHYLKTQAKFSALAEKAPGEIFKWLGWITAIAAVKVVATRTDSVWLQLLVVFLCWLVIMRAQWFIGIKYPETKEPDGSLLVKFGKLKTISSFVATALVWYIVFGAANLIAESGLLPLQALPQATTSAPAQLPMAKPVETQGLK